MYQKEIVVVPGKWNDIYQGSGRPRNKKPTDPTWHTGKVSKMKQVLRSLAERKRDLKAPSEDAYHESSHTMSGHLQGLITARHTHRLVLFQPLLYCPFILPWPRPSSVEIKDTSNGPTMNRNADCTQSFVSLITWELWLCEDTGLCVHVIFVTNHFLRTFGSLWWVSKKACTTELTVASCTCSEGTDFSLCFLL